MTYVQRVHHIGPIETRTLIHLVAEWIEKLPLQAISQQRWYAGKGREIESCRCLDLVPVGRGEPAGWICLVEMLFADGTGEAYHLPLAWLRQEAAEGKLESEPPWRVEIDTGGGLYCLRSIEPGDGLWTEWLEAWHRGLELRGRLGRIRFGRSRSRRSVDAMGNAFPFAAVSSEPKVRELEADQSNTSFVIDERSLLKVYRRIEPGPHPEVELCRFLTEESEFDGLPAVEGWAEYQSDDGRVWSLALVQQFIAEAGDGWTVLMEALRAKEGAGCSTAKSLPKRLGRLTADLHLSLAGMKSNGDLVEGPMTPDEVEVLKRQALSNLKRCREAARSDPGGVEELLENAQRVLDGLDPQLPAGRRQRVHGDYHLGQILCRGAELYIVDFEGEPARPLAERRQCHSPLKDVAGMLRSFSYAVAVAGESEEERRSAPKSLRDALASWERRARSDFLDAYGTRMAARRGPEDRLPPPGPRDVLLAFFELDKAVYELLYELRNRPHLAGVPVEGIRQALARLGS